MQERRHLEGETAQLVAGGDIDHAAFGKEQTAFDRQCTVGAEGKQPPAAFSRINRAADGDILLRNDYIPACGTGKCHRRGKRTAFGIEHGAFGAVLRICENINTAAEANRIRNFRTDKRGDRFGGPVAVYRRDGITAYFIHNAADIGIFRIRFAAIKQLLLILAGGK